MYADTLLPLYCCYVVHCIDIYSDSICIATLYPIFHVYMNIATVCSDILLCTYGCYMVHSAYKYRYSIPYIPCIRMVLLCVLTRYILSIAKRCQRLEHFNLSSCLEKVSMCVRVFGGEWRQRAHARLCV